MAKYIIDIEDEYTKDWINDTPMCKEFCMPISVPNRQRTYHVSTGFKLEPYTEPDRKAIEDEVWEFVRIITDMTEKQRIECFGGASCDLDEYWTYQDAKAKYEAWKKSKDEIRVGDEVVYADDPNKEKATVLRLYQPKQYKPLADILCEDGTVVKMVVVENLAWTGRRFNEVAELLKKMREE